MTSVAPTTHSDKKEFLVKQVCPVCGSGEKTVLYRDLIHTCNVLKKSGINLTNEETPADIYVCKNCKHKYLSIIIKEEFINYYYSVPESEYYDVVKDNPYDRVEVDTENFARLIKEKCSDASTVLEIGSGLGHLLYQLKLKGFECTGVEPSHFASTFSKEKLGLNVITGLLDYTTLPGRQFDVIILRDVVEHIYNINALFDLIEHYLAPGGRVVVLTGDSNSLYAKICGKRWLYFFSWEHISFFNKSSITYLYKKHFLEVQYFKKIRHSKSYWENVRVFLMTFRSMFANLIRVRHHKFYYMTFDHFIAIGRSTNNKTGNTIS